ncbi:MAG: hypothetical protein PHU03_06775 [Syntrophales bacterium]|nr:hypothetical protein [Syntrophales bacterium]
MKKGLLTSAVVVMAMLAMSACSGGLRYSKTEPEAAHFRPRSIAIISIDVGPHKGAAVSIDRIIADQLVRTGRYDKVLTPEETRDRTAEAEAVDFLKDYLAKLEIVNYSDPDLSGLIGEALGVEAFLSAVVSFWGYTVNAKGKDIAKVGLEMRLIDVSTGRILWSAHHIDENRYRVFKPDLDDVGRQVAKRMIMAMPR